MADASPSRCRRPICGRTTFPRRDKRLIPVTDKRGATRAEFDAYATDTTGERRRLVHERHDAVFDTALRQSRHELDCTGGRTPIDRAVELQSRRRTGFTWGTDHRNDHRAAVIVPHILGNDWTTSFSRCSLRVRPGS
jgi:hypothetical protein